VAEGTVSTLTDLLGRYTGTVDCKLREKIKADGFFIYFLMKKSERAPQKGGMNKFERIIYEIIKN
jgi:hypothetical protein